MPGIAEKKSIEYLETLLERSVSEELEFFKENKLGIKNINTFYEIANKLNLKIENIESLGGLHYYLEVLIEKESSLYTFWRVVLNNTSQELSKEQKFLDKYKNN